MIRVLVVEDSPTIAKVISAILNSDPAIIVVGIATTGLAAVEATSKLKPDIITMDIHLPGEMNGFESTKQIMAYFPTPILVLSSSVFVNKGGCDKVFLSLSYGALDFMEKAAFEGEEVNEQAENELIEKIKFLSRIPVIPHPLAKFEKMAMRKAARLESLGAVTQGRIVGIVASTGGPQVLDLILKSLPKNFSAPIVIVQHISPGFTDGLVEWLNTDSHLKIKTAENQELLNPGTAYVAPSALQMRVTKMATISLTNESPVAGQCPSGNILLESIAASYGSKALAVILSGMGQDGVQGLQAVHAAKGVTIAQDEKSSIVFGMPKAAIERGVVDQVLPAGEIAQRISQWLNK